MKDELELTINELKVYHAQCFGVETFTRQRWIDTNRFGAKFVIY